ncbi:MAG: GWxTD domain-containing protein, partial [Candidatus Latescibacteria bacterium]|nr:GWxTD domain-containing protein [Candidatus Latescibacterota bacterium]
MFCRLGMVILCLTFRVSASELSPLDVVGDLGLEVDTYSFLNDDGLYEEIAIHFPAKHLTFVPQGDSLFVARYAPRLQIFDGQDNLVKKIEGLRQYTLPSDISVDDHFVDDITRFQLAPGDYRAILVVEAVDNARVGRTTFSFQVPAHKTGQLFLSDVMFFREKQMLDPNLEMHSFEKNGEILLPAPMRAFDANGSLGFYVSLSEIGQLAHLLTVQVLDRFGHTVYFDERKFPTYREKAYFTENISLRGLIPGGYTLQVQAQADNQVVTTERRFRILGQPVSHSGTFTEQRQKLMQQVLERYSGAEIAAQYEKLSVNARAEFAYGHWLVRQPYFARAYVGPVTGLGQYEMPLSIFRALGHSGTLKKRVDKTFAKRVSLPDTLQIREAREMLKVFLGADDAYAAVANAVLFLEGGFLADGDDRAQQVCKNNPDLSYAFQVLGLAKIGRKDWNGAIRHFERAKELAPNWKSGTLNKALVHFLSGKGGDEEAFVLLREAAQQDSMHPWLHYMIGRIYERQDSLKESAKAYLHQVLVNPLYGRAHFDRGRILFKQGHIDSATVIWRALLEDRPDFRDICISPLLEAYLNTSETGKAQALIAEELRTLSEEARARVEDVSLVASPEEWTAYEALSVEDRPRFVRAFWQKRDPTPATPGNERLVEHYRRVVHALRNFSRDGDAWDRRGDIYIRYGEPAHVSKRGDVRYETDQQVVRVKERLLNMLSPEAKQEIVARATRLRTSTRDVEIESEGAEAVEVHDFESIDFEMNPNRVFFASGSDDVNTYIRGKELFGRDRVGMSDKTIRGLPLYPVNGSEPWEYWIYPDV